MASNIIGHSATPKVLAGVLAGGVALILIGALAGKSVAVIAGLCGGGSFVTLVATFGIAVKIDHYFRKKRIESEPVTPYTPASYQTDLTMLEFKKTHAHDLLKPCLSKDRDYLRIKQQSELDISLRKHDTPGVRIRNPLHWDQKIDGARLDFGEYNRNEDHEL